MDDARYFSHRANECAAAARETTDSWFAQRLSELAADFTALAAGRNRALPQDAQTV